MYRLAAALVLAALPAAAQVPPDEAWRTLATEHFRVTFPAHLEDLGRNAADVAERAYRALSAQFLPGPAGPIDLLLTDHLDVSNGSAQVWPSNRITVYARPPADHLALAYSDDWMELVVIHELAHVIHLDRTGPLGRVVRGVFGRVGTGWPFFPGYSVPGWVIEGIATWYESALTHAGRVQGTFHEMVLRTAALEASFETIGQAGGNSPVWPSGIRRYAYGSLFLDYLVERHGPDRVAAFVEAVAGQWAPYRLDAAGEQAFGVSLSSEWTAWADAARDAAQALPGDVAALGPITAPETLTPGSRQGLHPQVSPDGRALVYVRSDGRSDPRLVSARPDGGDPSTVARTNHVTTFDFGPSGEVVFAQRDFTDRYRIFSDLYVVAPGGSARRVTWGARLSAPSVGPAGAWAVAVADGGGTNALVRVDLRDGSTEPLVAAVPGTYWADPAVSPDGRWIAVTRWTAGRHDVVILDAAGRLVHEVTHDRALDLAPDWDAGGRYLVWASDRTGILNVLGAEVDPRTGITGPPVLLTNMRTGAAFPSVDPADRWLYFSGYHADGWEVERIRFRPDGAAPAPDPDPRFVPVAAAAAGRAEGPVRGYSPLPTLAPTWWSPTIREPVATARVRTADGVIPRKELLGYAIGARTSAVDLVGRHAYEAGAQVFTSGGRAEGDLSYEYRRLGNPTLGLNVSQAWNAGGVTLGRPPDGADAAPDALFVLERERRLATSVTMRRPTMRSTVALTFSGGLVRQDRELLDDALQTTRRYQLARPGSTLSELALALSVSTARTHAFQMGNTRGASLFVRARLRDDLHPAAPAPGRSPDDGSVTDVIGRAAAYLPLPGRRFAAAVLALRAAVGMARGPGADASHFNVGGAAGNTTTIAGGFPRVGGPAVFFPVRGYGTSTRSGRQAWTASVEYRTPLALVNRGVRAWPLHVDRIFGSLFIDVGDAWGSSAVPSGVHRVGARVLTSAGVEVTTDLLVLYGLPLRVRVGAAFPLVESTGAVAYVRLGVPF